MIFSFVAVVLQAQSACVSRPAAPVAQRWAAAAARAHAIACEKLAPEIPGFAIAVAVNGRIVWSEAFGYADLDAKRPATAATQFRIGSVSKPLTAAAIAQLFETGKLDIDAPVQRYVPSFPDKAAPITTRLVGGHLAGIRHYQGAEFTLNRRFATVAEGLSVFANDSLLFPPGTRFSYSSYGFNLLSAVVEGASHEEFLAYMSRHVFGPLHMTGGAGCSAAASSSRGWLITATSGRGADSFRPPRTSCASGRRCWGPDS